MRVGGRLDNEAAAVQAEVRAAREHAARRGDVTSAAGILTALCVALPILFAVPVYYLIAGMAAERRKYAFRPERWAATAREDLQEWIVEGPAEEDQPAPEGEEVDYM